MIWILLREFRSCVLSSLQGQRALRESQAALLEKVEELSEQLKQERQKALTLEGELSTTSLSLQTLDKLSITLFQIKVCTSFSRQTTMKQTSPEMCPFQPQAFRMQQESREGLGFLLPDGGLDDPSRELASLQASHAETVLELQKTRNLLLLEHKITKDLQVQCSQGDERTLHRLSER
uniref:Uncharacterized protein n=1 Tax=Fundulus heteroclitus TaxID=8078 RepID=A0A3Q2Q0D6_FUNHE